LVVIGAAMGSEELPTLSVNVPRTMDGVDYMAA
jgi:hypothetical protein